MQSHTAYEGLIRTHSFHSQVCTWRVPSTGPRRSQVGVPGPPRPLSTLRHGPGIHEPRRRTSLCHVSELISGRAEVKVQSSSQVTQLPHQTQQTWLWVPLLRLYLDPSPTSLSFRLLNITRREDSTSLYSVKINSSGTDTALRTASYTEHGRCVHASVASLLEVFVTIMSSRGFPFPL